MRYADNSIVSNPGTKYHVVYSPKVDDKGRVTLVESGLEDTDAYIQSFEESTDIHNILTRIQAGEVELLNKRPGSYGDFTQAPKTFADALQLQIDSKRLYDSLPQDVKAKFGFSSDQFFAQAGTEDWYANMEETIPKEIRDQLRPAVPVPSDPVKEVKE